MMHVSLNHKAPSSLKNKRPFGYPFLENFHKTFPSPRNGSNFFKSLVVLVSSDVEDDFSREIHLEKTVDFPGDEFVRFQVSKPKQFIFRTLYIWEGDFFL